jgi:hypothetical protein
MDGNQTIAMSKPAASDAGEGQASCYFSVVFVTSRNRRMFRLLSDHPENFIPLPGGGCAVPNPFGPGCESLLAARNGCSMQSVRSIDVHHGVGISEMKCVCSSAQVGNPNKGARFRPLDGPPMRADTHSGSAALGAPLVYVGEQSGAQMWHFWPEDPNSPSWESVEVRHFDGTIATYERNSTSGILQELDDQGQVVSSRRFWRLQSTRDAHDNVTTYHYLPNGRLRYIAYPSGIHEHWNWQPTWVQAGFGASFSAIEVSYSISPDLAQPVPAELLNLNWSMVFENVPAQGGGPASTHFAGRWRYFIAQAAHYVPDPASGQLYDVGANTFGHVVTEFVHNTTPGSHVDEITLVRKHWLPYGARVAPSPNSGVTTLETEYASGRVVRHTQPLLGVATTYAYRDVPTYPHPLPSGVQLSVLETTHPDGSRDVREPPVSA